jgi:hypothetical protein
MDSILLDNASAVFIAGAAGLLLLLCAVLCETRRREGRWFTPVSLFFVFITIHAIGGYELAFVSASQIGRSGAGMEFYFVKAYAIICLGAYGIFLGYLLCPAGVGMSAAAFLVRVSSRVSESEMADRARFFITISIVLTAAGMAQYGSIPLFQNLAHRYTDTFNPAYGWVAFTVNRGRDLVQLPTALMIIMLLRRRQSSWNVICVLVALIACVLTVTRTPIIDILLIVIVASSLRGRASMFLFGGALVLVGYLCTQLLFVKDEVDSADRVLQIAGGALPELRDLGHVLTNPPDLLWGLTFLVGSLPVPGFFSEFTSAYLIRTVTLNAVGIPLTAAHGGLRITYSGELYINFGIVGVILGSLLLGVFAGWFGRLCSAARMISDVRLDFLMASLWMMFSFQLYLSGSGVAGMLKVMLFVLALFFVPIRRAISMSRQPDRLETAVPVAVE